MISFSNTWLFVANVIDVGIEIMPTKVMCAQMSSGIATFESEVYNLYQGRSTASCTFDFDRHRTLI